MQLPTIQKTPDGMLAVEYTNPDGSKTYLKAATENELIQKLSAAHQLAVGALDRSRKQQAENARVAAEATAAANTERVILAWLRNASTEYGGEYFVCSANNDILIGWLRDRELPITSDNLTMAFRALQESNSLAQAPQPEADPEPQEEPLSETPKGYPVVNSTAEVRAIQNLRGWLDTTKHTPQAIAAFKARINAILTRDNVRRQRVAAGSLAGGR